MLNPPRITPSTCPIGIATKPQSPPPISPCGAARCRRSHHKSLVFTVARGTKVLVPPFSRNDTPADGPLSPRYPRASATPTGRLNGPLGPRPASAARLSPTMMGRPSSAGTGSTQPSRTPSHCSSSLAKLSSIKFGSNTSRCKEIGEAHVLVCSGRTRPIGLVTTQCIVTKKRHVFLSLHRTGIFASKY